MATEPKELLQTALQWFIAKTKTIRTKKALVLATVASSLAVSALGLATIIGPPMLQASDHDDGEIDLKGRALNLTDLYAFREIDQNPNARADDIILVMNTNPRSLARVQYYFSTQAQYEFKISRVNNINGIPTATPDLTLRFTFGSPKRGFKQEMTLTAIERGGRTLTTSKAVGGGSILTTSLSNASTPTINRVRIGGATLDIFAGLREDPFFFDVEQYFRVRAGLLGTGPAVGFRPPATAVDFATGYNVNTIVVRVPRRLLQGATNTTAFDVWLSLNVQDPRTGQFVQTEHMARPGVNEILVINQRNYETYNRTMPTRTVDTRVAADIGRVLASLGNSPSRINGLLGAVVPDVMRIDTTIPSGYATVANNRGALIAGRKLLDDVIDDSLTALTNGAVTTDNVSYSGTPGNPSQGHDPLEPNFPYLALPN